MKSRIIAISYSATVEFLYNKCINLALNPCTCQLVDNITLFRDQINSAISSDEIIFIVVPCNINQHFLIKNILSQITQAQLVNAKNSANNVQQFCLLNNIVLPQQDKEKLAVFPDNFMCYNSAYGYFSNAQATYLGKRIYLICDNIDETNYTFNNYIHAEYSQAITFNSFYYFKIFGLNSTEVEARINELESNKLIKCTVTTDITLDTTLELSVVPAINRAVLEKAFELINAKFKKELYSSGNKSLAEAAYELLSKKNLKISVAESVTGGMICDKLVDVSGISGVFNEGIVCYSNNAKTERLFVPGEIISQYGAVSNETAYEMAIGLLKNRNCDIVLSTTGIAGPTGASPNKPIGLCYIGVGDFKGIHVYKHIFSGSRQQVRLKATNTALFYLINQLTNIN